MTIFIQNCTDTITEYCKTRVKQENKIFHFSDRTNNGITFLFLGGF